MKAGYVAQVNYRKKHPQKHKANDIVNKRIERGVSLTRQPCIVCNTPNAEAHHEDYNKPLDIVWLCKQHHEALHTINGRAKDMMDIAISHTIQHAMLSNNDVSLSV